MTTTTHNQQRPRRADHPRPFAKPTVILTRIMWILEAMASLLAGCQAGMKALFTKIVSDLQASQIEIEDGQGKISVENVSLEEDKELSKLFSSRNNARPLPGEPFMVPLDVEVGLELEEGA